MAALLITYDLNQEVKRPPIVAKIRSEFSSWARLSESSYAVQTNLTPRQVFDVLKPLLDQNDSLYVITLTAPYHGQGAKDVNDWLKAAL